MPSPTQRVLSRVPLRFRPFLVRYRRPVKFLLVGGTCFLLTMGLNYGLRQTVFAGKPVVALTVATVVATVVSYVLNRQWSFRAYGRQREAALYLLVSGLAVLVNDAPLVVSRYLLELREPHVTASVEETADFVSGMIVGTFLAMLFRYWAMKRWVFTRRADLLPADRPRSGAGR
ncbi:GtrA family protein [Kitasatospora sp. CMC57]|uniref:GtrA family protein n=1 Tax=Kitasatospora sp. CMC57 TaxID=3231513 RepID=A0AB33JTX5_9ACTN